MFGRTTSAKVNVKGIDISAIHVRAHSCHLGMLFSRKDVFRGQCPPLNVIPMAPRLMATVSR